MSAAKRGFLPAAQEVSQSVNPLTGDFAVCSMHNRKQQSRFAAALFAVVQRLCFCAVS